MRVKSSVAAHRRHKKVLALTKGHRATRHSLYRRAHESMLKSLSYSYGHRREPYGVRACLSEDGGDTWDLDNEVVLRDDGLGRDMGYPSSEQLEDGDILTVYYWHSEDEIRYLAGTRWNVDRA